MKIICLIKTFSGGCWAEAALESVYAFCDKIIYLHSHIDWQGRTGNDVAGVVDEWIKKNDTAGKIDVHWLDTTSQEEQYKSLWKYAADHEHDFKMLQDCDEVWTDDALDKSKAFLTRITKANAFTCDMQSYIKSPLYQIKPLDACHPVVFIRNGCDYVGVRGAGIPSLYNMSGVVMHHFTGIRENLHLVWEKHAVSSFVENEPLADKKQWVETKWNALPNATDFHPNKNFAHTWGAIHVVGVDELPVAVRKSPVVKAFAKYQFGLGMKFPQITNQLLKKHGLPVEFRPGHADWNVPSKKAKYKLLLKEIEDSMCECRLPPPTTEAVVIQTEQKTREPDIRELSPSKRNRLYSDIKNSGKTCVVTMVSGIYQWYIPLFVYQLHREYPEYDVQVLLRGKCDLPEKYMGHVLVINDDLPIDGYTTAALRFVWDYPGIESYDYVLITDVDVMMNRETPAMLDQRMKNLRMFDLGCYENYVSGIMDGKPRMPGVHFVTKDWWGKTSAARKKYSDFLKINGSPAWYFDEVMLADIVKESGLPVQDKEPHLWGIHGIHLGDYRRQIETKQIPKLLDGGNSLFAKRMCDDKEFMAIVRDCAQHIPTLDKTFKTFAEMTGAGK